MIVFSADVFHKTCLQDYGEKMPLNTAPAGYRCPVCSSCIFPANNVVSPVADALREVLKTFDWAQVGLGMPLVRESVLCMTYHINNHCYMTG